MSEMTHDDSAAREATALLNENEVLRARIEALVAYGKSHCYKHGDGDDACCCDRWDALAKEKKP